MHRPVLPAGLVVALSLVLCSTSQAALLDRGNGMIYDTDRNITWVSDADLFGTMRAADPSLGGYGLIDRIIGDVGSVSDGRITHTLSRNDFSATSVGANSGLLSWWGAMAFAQDLVYGGFDDWRLPTSLQPDPACSTQRHLNANGADVSYGTGCTGSELGHLFYTELGGVANVPLTVTHNSQYGLFSDVRTDDWTGTPFLVPSSGDAAWGFDTTSGRQLVVAIDSIFAAGDPGSFSFAWIVRTGDVAAVGQPVGNAIPEPAIVLLMFAGVAAIGITSRRRLRTRPARDAATKRWLALLSALPTVGLASNAAHAALIDRGNGLIYDTSRNITWVSDADLFGTMNAADTGLVARIIADVGTVSDGSTTHTLTTNDFAVSSSGRGGYMSWWGAMAFAQDLRYGGFDDWRLPTSLQPDTHCSRQFRDGSASYSFGTGCTGSELGELYYDELGGVADVNLQLVHNDNFSLFSNVRTDYWTGTPFVSPGAADAAWYFESFGGDQDLLVITDTDRPTNSYAWIVRTGDVAAVGQPVGNAVPEPATLSLTLAGLGVATLTGRRRRRRTTSSARSIVRTLTGSAAAVFLTGAAHAALIDRGNGLIYDTDRNITWAQDVSLLTTRYDADPDLVAKIIAAVPTVTENGHTHTLTSDDFRELVFIAGTSRSDRAEASWWGSMAFAQYVTLDGVGGWRLPTTLTPDPSCSINGGPATSPLTGCSGSEMGHIYYDEFGARFVTVMPSHPDDYALFSNFGSQGGFWSATTYQGPGFPDAAFFFTPNGRQGLLSDLSAYATPWIVHDGDIGATAQPGGGGDVPEPAVVSLIFAGAGAIGVSGRRRRPHRNHPESA